LFPLASINVGENGVAKAVASKSVGSSVVEFYTDKAGNRFK
jgi:hypothetical protein